MLIGGQQEDVTPITHHEAVSQSPNTSWYLDEKEITINELLPIEQRQNEEINKTVELEHENKICADQEIVRDERLGAVIEIVTSGDSHSSEVRHSFVFFQLNNLLSTTKM